MRGLQETRMVAAVQYSSCTVVRRSVPIGSPDRAFLALFALKLPRLSPRVFSVRVYVRLRVYACLVPFSSQPLLRPRRVYPFPSVLLPSVLRTLTSSVFPSLPQSRLMHFGILSRYSVPVRSDPTVVPCMAYCVVYNAAHFSFFHVDTLFLFSCFLIFENVFSFFFV